MSGTDVAATAETGVTEMPEAITGHGYNTRTVLYSWKLAPGYDLCSIYIESQWSTAADVEFMPVESIVNVSEPSFQCMLVIYYFPYPTLDTAVVIYASTGCHITHASDTRRTCKRMYQAGLKSSRTQLCVMHFSEPAPPSLRRSANVLSRS